MEEAFFGGVHQRRLVERIGSGDRSAEEELASWFYPRVFATLVARTGDREASRDLAQDVLIGALRTLRAGAIEEPDKLAHFIQGIARNLANSHLRTQALRRPRENALPHELAERIAAPIRDYDESAAREEENVALALAELDPADREILLQTLQGRKPREIAASLRLSSDVIRQRKCRAVQRIRDSVKKLSRIGRIPYLADGKGPA